MYQDVKLLTSLVGRLLNSHHSRLKADHQLAGVHPSTQEITRIAWTGCLRVKRYCTIPVVLQRDAIIYHHHSTLSSESGFSQRSAIQLSVLCYRHRLLHSPLYKRKVLGSLLATCWSAIGHFFSLSSGTVPDVFAKVNSAVKTATLCWSP